MNNIAAANTSLKLDMSGSFKADASKVEAIALCSAFMLTFVLIVIGNLLTIVLFAMNQSLKKKSLFLIINMAFADLILGTVTLPIYIYQVGREFKVWTNRTGEPWSNNALFIFFLFTDTTFSQASIISAVFISCEKFYAINCPLKHRTLSMRAYRIVICMVWILALLISAVWTASNSLHSKKLAQYVWVPCNSILIFIICGCNIGIWRKFQHGRVVFQQENRAALNKRLTKTLMFVSVLALLSWLPLIIFNFLIVVIGVPIPWKFYFMVNVLNYSNSFVNPVVYALRIPEFRQALGLCCFRRQAVINIEPTHGTRNCAAVLTPVTEPRTFRNNPGHLQLEEEVEDTKL